MPLGKAIRLPEAVRGDRGHARSKATRRHQLLSLFIAKLQAGEDWVHALDDSNLTLMEVTSADRSASARFEVQDEVANATPAKGELIFNKYGESLLPCEVV